VSLVESNVSFNSAIGLNSASGHAGGVYADRGITMDTSHVDSNSARDAGGILNVFGSVEVTDQSTVDNNTSNGHALQKGDLGGGGISEMDGNVIIADGHVNNNKTIGMYSGGIVLCSGRDRHRRARLTATPTTARRRDRRQLRRAGYGRAREPGQQYQRGVGGESSTVDQLRHQHHRQ
jgi:hypothetical protein